jgi:hypothetical protein
MVTNPKLIGLLLATLLWLADPAAGQVLPHEPDQLSNDYQPYPLRQTPFYFELNLILQPVYIFQRSSSEYRLNGQPLNIPKSFLPRFYSTQPFQKAFSSIGETADQANSLYGSFYLTFWKIRRFPSCIIFVWWRAPLMKSWKPTHPLDMGTSTAERKQPSCWKRTSLTA